MKHKVSELEGALLDAAVAKCFGNAASPAFVAAMQVLYGKEAPLEPSHFRPSANWQHGGLIIDRAPWCLPRVNTNSGSLHMGRFAASTPGGFDHYGPTALIAAMRAYAASVFGVSVELP